MKENIENLTWLQNCKPRKLHEITRDEFFLLHVNFYDLIWQTLVVDSKAVMELGQQHGSLQWLDPIVFLAMPCNRSRNISTQPGHEVSDDRWRTGCRCQSPQVYWRWFSSKTVNCELRNTSFPDFCPLTISICWMSDQLSSVVSDYQLPIQSWPSPPSGTYEAKPFPQKAFLWSNSHCETRRRELLAGEVPRTCSCELHAYRLQKCIVMLPLVVCWNFEIS